MNGYNTKQNECVDLDEWRKAVREARIYHEAEAKKLNERLESLYAELNRIKEEEGLIDQAARSYKARLQQPSKRSPLQGANLRETLIIHFAEPNGIILGKAATKTLVDVGYFSDRKAADSAIYTTLSKPPFQKVSKGVYFIPPDSPDWNRLKGTNGKEPDIHRLVRLAKQHLHKPTRTSLVDRVKNVLAEHPDWKIKQVSRELQRQGWDFKDKNPNLAVSGAFMRIRGDRKRASNQTPSPHLYSNS